jgi:hypothetical protein
MKAIGAIIVALALVIGVVPQFTDCLSQGGAIRLSDGTSIPMRCHWTRQAEIAVALPLAVVGVATLASRRRSILRVLSIVTISLGLGAVLLPTTLIGVCTSEEMICNLVMKPTLLFAGILTMAVGLVGLVYLRDDGSQDAPPT